MLNFREKTNQLILAGILVLLYLAPLMIIRENYALVDKSKNYYAEEYSRNVFQSVESNSLIISWWNYTTPLRYRKYVLQERPDIIIINAGQNGWKGLIDKNIGVKPVYLVENEKEVGKYYKIIQHGHIYKVLSK